MCVLMVWYVLTDGEVLLSNVPSLTASLCEGSSVPCCTISFPTSTVLSQMLLLSLVSHQVKDHCNFQMEVFRSYVISEPKLVKLVDLEQ